MLLSLSVGGYALRLIIQEVTDAVHGLDYRTSSIKSNSLIIRARDFTTKIII